MTGYLFWGGYDWPMADLIGLIVWALLMVWLVWYVLTRRKK